MTSTHVNTRTGDRAGFTTVVGGALLLTVFAVNAIADVVGVGVISGRGDYFAAYTILSLGALLLAAGLSGTAMVYRRRFGTMTLAGLVSGAAGALVMCIGAMLNFTAATPSEATTGGAVIFGGIALSAFAAFLTGSTLWRIDVTRSSAGVLVAAFFGFLLALLVGELITSVAGIQLAWSVCGILLSFGWLLFGNFVHSSIDTDKTERVAQVV